MDLEQLYQERFQTFEMEPSSDTSLKMKNKISHFKAMQLIKWIVVGVVVSATIAVISFFIFNSNEPQALLNSNESLLREQSIETINKENQQKTTAAIIKTRQEDDIKPTSADKKDIKEMTDEDKEDSKHIINQADQMNSEVISEENIAISSKVSENSFEDEKSTVSSDKDKEQYATKLSSVEMKTVSLQINPETLHLDQRNDNLLPQEHVASKNVNWNAYFGLHFSPFIMQNKGVVEAPEMDTSWTYSLNHKSLLSYEFGFSFQLHHKKSPLFMQFGMDYQILKEKIDFQFNHTIENMELSYWTYDSTFEVHDIIDTIYIIVDSNQFVIDTIFTQDTVLSHIDSLYNPVMDTEEDRIDHINTYTYLNIPLLLGYEFQSKNKRWNFQILAGAAVAINLSNKGYYYTKTGEFRSYSGKVNPSMVWNLYAAANINYQLKKWQIFLQPEYQHQLNGSQIPNSNQRKYRFYKIKFGIRYQLF